MRSIVHHVWRLHRRVEQANTPPIKIPTNATTTIISIKVKALRCRCVLSTLFLLKHFHY